MCVSVDGRRQRERFRVSSFSSWREKKNAAVGAQLRWRLEKKKNLGFPLSLLTEQRESSQSRPCGAFREQSGDCRCRRCCCCCRRQSPCRPRCAWPWPMEGAKAQQQRRRLGRQQCRRLSFSVSSSEGAPSPGRAAWGPPLGQRRLSTEPQRRMLQKARRGRGERGEGAATRSSSLSTPSMNSTTSRSKEKKEEKKRKKVFFCNLFPLPLFHCSAPGTRSPGIATGTLSPLWCKIK